MSAHFWGAKGAPILFLHSNYLLVGSCRESESNIQEKKTNKDDQCKAWHKQLLNSVQVAGVFCTWTEYPLNVAYQFPVSLPPVCSLLCRC